MKLIIVESPAKARTIERFLGPDYRVTASYGHIRDLPSSAREIPEQYRAEPWARLGVDTEGGFQPVYVVSAESQKHVTALKKLVKQADELLLATDEDREGEAISWHLLQVLQPKIPVRRITFHEITKAAVEHALANPRELDRRLVRAQESRRILDRLYGYSLSPVLWKKVRTKLSAGRVQSVAVRLVVEREEERRAFRRAEYWDVEARLRSAEGDFMARLVRVGEHRLAGGKDFAPETGALKSAAGVRVLEGTEAGSIAAGAPSTLPWRVDRVERKQARQRPAPPFITSTLQQAAGARLGFSPKRTMQVAQRLYEGIDLGGREREGLITYMRTDSVTLAEKALQEAAAFVRSHFGERYTDGPRRYKTKSKSAQEAHEAIRPTDVRRTPEMMARCLDRDELALYRLIWSRALASQMTDAELDKTTVDLAVNLPEGTCLFRATGSVVRFPGWLAVQGGGPEDSLLPELQEGSNFADPGDAKGEQVLGCEARRHETTPPPRYTEASLVKKLEEEGIGRPSTYAPVISTIQQRGYVVKKSGSLVPTYIGLAVTELLRRHFERYVNLRFTAEMEEDLDHIAAGDIDGEDFLSAFYHGADGDQNGLLQRIERELPAIDFPAFRLGRHPETGEPVTVRIGRNYVYVQVGDGGEDRRATVPVDLLIDELTLEKALELVAARARSQQPLGQDPDSGENVYLLVGPYGPYLQLGEAAEGRKPKRVGLDRTIRPEDVDLELALRLLSLPRVVGQDPETGRTITAGLGRFGPYVESGRVYAKLPSWERIFDVGPEEALSLIRSKSRRPVLKELGSHPETGAPLQVLDGRYGPYVSDGRLNATLPKGRDPREVDLEEALALLRAAAAKPRPGGRGKKAARKKARKKTGKKVEKKGEKAAKKTTRETSRKKGKKRATKKATDKPEKTARKKARKKTEPAGK